MGKEWAWKEGDTETQVLSLVWEDSLEKEMATQSSILAWRIPWTEELGGLQSMGSQRVGHDQAINTFIFLGYMSMGRIARSYDSSVFSFFKGTSILFYTVAASCMLF